MSLPCAAECALTVETWLRTGAVDAGLNAGRHRVFRAQHESRVLSTCLAKDQKILIDRSLRHCTPAAHSVRPSSASQHTLSWFPQAQGATRAMR